MAEGQDLPIALRRTPRASVGAAAGNPNPSRLSGTGITTSRNLTTPRKPKSKKRVRFSDPGPNIHQQDTSSTTGLTPMVRRTYIGPAPSPKRRRHSTPLQRSHTDEEEDELSNNSNGAPNEVRFLSLRQVLDDRVKRRIRRNGLSEEMNIINQEKRRRAQEQKAELQRLRDQLAEKDEEIERLQDTTMVQDTDRILELELEIRSLRDELNRRAVPDDDRTEIYDWTMAARDPFSHSFMDIDDNDDDDFGNTTMADLVCSTPSKNRASASFPTPPCTSPTFPSTPRSMRKATPVTPRSQVGVQVSLPDPEKEALEAELGSLRLELTKLTEVLESHEALKARIASKLVAASSTTSDSKDSPSKDVEAHLDSVLQSLSDRTAALLDLNTSLSSLGFPGNDAGEIVTSLTGAFRSARLELEYLTPGEITLPLSSRGAEVLDLVLTRLRDLGRQVREDEDAIDEYHALELSLRQQLNARVSAMDGMRAQLDERDARIADLELGTERLKGAAEGYRRDVAELERLVQEMEGAARAAETRFAAEAAGARAELADSRAAEAKLEAKLAAVREQADACRAQLADLQRRKAAEVRALNRYHGTALAVRDARVAELRAAVDDVGRSLHEAHRTVQQLRVENLGLGRRADEEKARAKEAVDAMKAELERVLRMSSDFLATPRKAPEASGRRLRSSTRDAAAAAATATAEAAGAGAEDGKEKSTAPEGSPLRPGAYLSGELAKMGKGAKRRKYDSGLGLLDEDEDGSVDLV